MADAALLDVAVPDAAAPDMALVDLLVTDRSQPDAISGVPWLYLLTPDNGPADGGPTGKGTPVVASGKNLAAGASVFIDGAPQVIKVTVTSSTSMSFVMPANPYSKNKATKVSVSVLIRGYMSNSLYFQYTI